MDVYQAIKEDIVTCNLRPGDMVNESELAAKYEVGRASVREALQDLIHDGLVESVPRVGYRVSAFTVKDILDLYGARAVLEPGIAALAAENATREEISRIRSVADAGFRLAEGESHTVLNRRNSDFHQAIAEASHNIILASIEATLLEKLERLFNLHVLGLDSTDVPPEVTDKQHRDIADAIASRDSQAARDMALVQIEASRQFLFRYLFEGELGADVLTELARSGS
jgi:DNA-binding GntR family transcriptional regulator